MQKHGEACTLGQVEAPSTQTHSCFCGFSPNRETVVGEGKGFIQPVRYCTYPNSVCTLTHCCMPEDFVCVFVLSESSSVHQVLPLGLQHVLFLLSLSLCMKHVQYTTAHTVTHGLTGGLCGKLSLHVCVSHMHSQTTLRKESLLFMLPRFWLSLTQYFESLCFGVFLHFGFFPYYDADDYESMFQFFLFRD